MGDQGVSPPRGVQEYRLLVITPLGSHGKTVTRLVAEPFRLNIMALGSTDPALLRQHDCDRIVGNQFGFAEGPGFPALDNG